MDVELKKLVAKDCKKSKITLSFLVLVIRSSIRSFHVLCSLASSTSISFSEAKPPKCCSPTISAKRIEKSNAFTKFIGNSKEVWYSRQSSLGFCNSTSNLPAILLIVTFCLGSIKFLNLREWLSIVSELVTLLFIIVIIITQIEFIGFLVAFLWRMHKNTNEKVIYTCSIRDMHVNGPLCRKQFHCNLQLFPGWK